VEKYQINQGDYTKAASAAGVRGSPENFTPSFNTMPQAKNEKKWKKKSVNSCDG